MTTFGKVLLFLNVLAAAAVAYFATDNWAKRQSLNATGLRYAVTLKGLPTEPQAGQPEALTTAPADDETVAVRLPTGTGRTTEDVPFRLLKTHFAGADGKATFGSPIPPLSVKGEVVRVQKAVETHLTNLGNDPARLAWLCGTLEPTGAYTPGYLTLLADSYGERQVLRRLLTLPGVAAGGRDAEIAVNLAKARDILAKRFAAVTAAPSPKTADADAGALADAQKAVKAAELAALTAHQAEGQLRIELKADPENKMTAGKLATAVLETKDGRDKLTAAVDALEVALSDIGRGASRDDADRRRRALLLLAHLDPTDAPWQKRVMLLFGQPEYLRAQADRVEKLNSYPSLLDDERLAADARFFAEYEQMKQGAKDRDRYLERVKEELAEVQSQVDAAKKLLAQRQTYRDERAVVAKGFSDQVKSLADEQETVEGELFAIQLKVGRLLRENFDLEDRLLVAERQAVPPVGR